jgi:hypothetical protein
MQINLDRALAMAAAARREAETINVPMVIAVVNGGGKWDSHHPGGPNHRRHRGQRRQGRG